MRETEAKDTTVAAACTHAAAYDEGLLAACNAYHKAHSRFVAGHLDVSEDELNGLCLDSLATLTRVARLPHHTLPGLLAKAGVGYSAMMFRVAALVGKTWREQATDTDKVVLDTLAGLGGSLSGDGDLIATCHEFDALERQIKAIFAPGGLANEAERDAAEAPLKAAQQPLLDRLCTIKATTPAGCIARARSLALWDGGEDFGEDNPEGYADDRMVAALVRDLAAMGAGA